MGLVQLPAEVQEVVRILKHKIQTAPVLVFPDFDKPFLLETDASQEGLGSVLLQKQDNGCYHPVTFGSHSLMPSEKNYHSPKHEFLLLKWSVTEHFKKYHAYAPFVVRTDNNLLTPPNLDAMGLKWVGVLASFEFTLKYQKWADNGAVDTFSHFPICHDCETVWPLLEGAIMGAVDHGEAEASEELPGKHEHLSNEVLVQAARMVPVHTVDWEEAQEADPMLAASCMKEVAPYTQGYTALEKRFLAEKIQQHGN